jgi:hypothetical protein
MLHGCLLSDNTIGESVVIPHYLQSLLKKKHAPTQTAGIFFKENLTGLYRVAIGR